MLLFILSILFCQYVESLYHFPINSGPFYWFVSKFGRLALFFIYLLLLLLLNDYSGKMFLIQDCGRGGKLI